MACTNPQNPDCNNCNKAGLAILPVRYAVVPSNIFTFLPLGIGNKVTDVKLSHHRYALRTLRQGFVYLFYEKSARGVRNAWEVYSVTPNGTVWKQLSIMAIQPKPDEPSCSGSGHNIPTSVITIEKPEKCGKVWIAFSEHKWSPETFKEFAGDVKLRDRRMQTIVPAMWVKNKTYRHGVEATQANIETVVEYQDSFNTYSLEPGALPIISKEDGSHIPTNLKKCSTRYPLHMRTGQSKTLADKIKQIGEHPQGHYPGMVMAVWDTVGITHELNGFRNDATGWIKKYSQERELELTAMSAIDGVRKALEDKAGQHARAASEYGVWKWTAAESAKRKANAQHLYAKDPVRLRHEIELCDLWEKDAAQKVPSHIAMPRQYSVTLSDKQWAENMAKIDAQAAQYKTPDNSTGKSLAEKREERSQQWEKEAIDATWPKYQAKLSKDYENFKNNYNAFLSAADKLIEQRTEDLISWIESKSLINALTEYNDKDIDDGIAFEDAVGNMVFGISSSASGRKKFTEWAKEAQSTEYNLLWRSMALNQKERIEEVNVALKHAKDGIDTALTAESWAVALGSVKWNKLGDVYKKSQTFANTNIRAATSGGSMKEAKTLGFLKIFAAAGDCIMPNFVSKRIDSVISEKIMQNLFLLRAGAHVDDVLELVKEQAMRETPDRYAMIRRIQIAPAFANAMEDSNGKLRPNAEVLKEKWSKLIKNADTAGADGRFNAVKDARLAAIVAVLEAIYLGKAGYDMNVKKDAKSLVVLGSSAAALTSVAIDVYANVVKGALEETSLTFQRLKFYGGVFGGIASIGGTIAAAMDAEKYKEEGKTTLYKLAVANATVMGLAGLANNLVTLSYCGPWLLAAAEKQAAKRALIAGATRMAAAAAARLVMFRAILMGVGLGLNIVALGIQILIWKFSDNELQIWCEKSVFGIKRDKTWSIKILREEFYKATYAVGA